MRAAGGRETNKIWIICRKKSIRLRGEIDRFLDPFFSDIIWWNPASYKIAFRPGPPVVHGPKEQIVRVN